MKTIKTRNTAKGIKILDKSVSLYTRMKDAFVRTKESAEETKEPRSPTPTEYASDKVEETAGDAARETARGLPKLRQPQQRARENIDRVKSNFQEVRRQIQKPRRHIAEQSQRIARDVQTEVGNHIKSAGKTPEKVRDAKAAVRDAKQTLREVRQQGRQTLREVRQDVKYGKGGNGTKAITGDTPKVETPRPHSGAERAANPSGVKTAGQPKSASPMNGDISKNGGVSKPEYIGRAAKAPQVGAVDAAKPLKAPQIQAKPGGRAAKSTAKELKKTAKGTIKDARKSVKTAERAAKQVVKTAKQTAKTTRKTAQAATKTVKIAERTARAAAKAAVHTAKATVKASAAMLKTSIAAIKGLVAAIAAGGWIAVMIVLIICTVSLLFGSVYGIFFGNDLNSGTGKTINSVTSEIDAAYADYIDNIKFTNPHDSIVMTGERAQWSDILAVYAANTSAGAAAIMTDDNAAALRSVFWDMHTVTYRIEEEEVSDDSDDAEGDEETEESTEYILYINVSHKTAEEMAAQYGFTLAQTASLDELQKPEYDDMWSPLLYYGATSVGDGTMIGVAETQLGNYNGETYWRWYGFGERVPWCAIFVSWCAEQCGFIEAGIIPRFSVCETGAQWFRSNDRWQRAGYTPAPGDLIFLNWDDSPDAEHMGIVESADDRRVYTIEGNNSNAVNRNSYMLGSASIAGYGLPLYPQPGGEL